MTRNSTAADNPVSGWFYLFNKVEFIATVFSLFAFFAARDLIRAKKR